MGIICSLVEIELTDLTKSGGVMAPPAPSGSTPLLNDTNADNLGGVFSAGNGQNFLEITMIQ